MVDARRAKVEPVSHALLLETSLAAQTLCSGVTVLRRAEMGKNGIFYEAFFGMATGFERLCKLIIIIDHLLDHEGNFPTNKVLKGCAHHIQKLFCRVREVRSKYPASDPLSDYPEDAPIGPMLEFLEEFAVSTRYYNLDYLSNREQGAKHGDPIRRWLELVGTEILRLHYSDSTREHHQETASALGNKIGRTAFVFGVSHDGSVVSDLASIFRQGAQVDVVQEWGQFYALKLARYLSMLVSDLENVAHGRQFLHVPYLSEFLATFRFDDRTLKRLKVWKVYKS